MFDRFTSWVALTCFTPKKKTRISDGVNTSQTRHYHQDKFEEKASKYIEYYETSNLATLLGYRSIL